MSNIQIGIDLGTTNSEIAIINNDNVEILKNTLGDEYTPSVFGISKGGDEEVGKKPYNRYFKDCTKDEWENNKPEIKRLMGQEENINFPRINKSYLPEEISSKILLSLKRDVARKSDSINLNAAVITIPAHFGTTQCEATKRAGELAGFKYVVLLQEPIAAAISYGFSNDKNENWLVYDLGGGTFDVALIASRDGNLSVLGHRGDNFLGGKDIDNAIVDKKIVPFIQSKVPDFKRGDERYKVAFAKLKYAAEEAKKALSSANETTIEIDIMIDDNDIYENIKLSCNDLESITKELIDKTITCCKETIEESKIAKVDKIILVGGPTQLPFIRKRLENELKISVDTSSDPLTAVAKGACLYAMSLKIPDEFITLNKEIDENTYILKLNYESVSSSEDELITGMIEGLDDKKYFFRIQNQNNTYNSGEITLKNGKFSANVLLEPKKLNKFYIYLTNENGDILKISQDEFSITHGVSVSGAPIPHSIGVGISKKDYATGDIKQEYEIFFERNSILPLEKTKTFKALNAVSKGDSRNCLPITIYEGEYPIPDRNIEICSLSISGNDIKYSLKEGEDIEVTIKVSESREVSVEAYIPLSDDRLNARATIFGKEMSVDEIESHLEQEINRLTEISKMLSGNEKKDINDKVANLRQTIKKSNNDNDEKTKAINQLKDLQALIDNVKDSKNIDILKQKFLDLISNSYKLLAKIKDSAKNSAFKKQLDNLKTEGDNALNINDTISLSMIISQLEEINSEMFGENDDIWIDFFSELRRINPSHYDDPARAQQLISAASQALEDNDIERLRNLVIGLAQMLPEFKNSKGNIGSINKIAGITL